MVAYAFNGVTSGSTGIPFNPATDVLNLTYTQGFDTLNMQTDTTGTNVIVTTALGGTFLLMGVVLEQLSDANVVHTGGDFDIGDNGNNFLSGTIVLGLGGNDVINGSTANDFLQGNQGNDDIDGHGGMDRIKGGQGDDEIYNFGTDSVINGDRGADEIDADDDAEFTWIYGGNQDPSDPLDGGDDIDGSDGIDFIQGNGGDDQIYGDGGNDVIRGGKANDWLDGGSGDDSLRGDLGNDDLEGGRDADVMTGGDGNDGFWFYYDDSDDSVIQQLTRTNISEDALGVSASNFGLPQLDNLDSITDLDLGGQYIGDVDYLRFEGWNNSGETSTVSNVSANNMADLITAFRNEIGNDFDDQAVLIHVNGGSFAGKSFLLVSTSNDDNSYQEDPEYALQVTGVTGTFDDGDIGGAF
jgi:Ca2+-binding RTX toxin-like protein